ncbi:phage shock protein A, PspA [Psychromonas sp. CNPT3]|uniref:PspA/IM30 family protein n=1 Tax=Psychromonas sp. CNPT3 TaxID=314282 RepID=UPI00006E507D|nr:PspA/IM30 family protein [Psychromonas sp. CNPT3]AGH82448.1 phage shock protein A, PspA [Psychromonas sp. CNPT3]
MSIFKKIMSAVRGGAREAGEAIVDANSTRIFEQEIRDSEKHITIAKRNLTEVMAKQMQTARELAQLQNSIKEHEGYAIQALDQGNEALAIEVAEKIGELETSHSEQQQANESYLKNAQRLKDLIKKSERQLMDYKRQLSMIKTTESVQKATSAITDNFTASNSKLLNAKDSLERIKAKQALFDDKLKAAEQLESEDTDQSLKNKLKEAGIGAKASSAQSILDRLKSK